MIRPSLRAKLDLIDEMLIDDPTDGRDLYLILSALRAHDSEIMAAKTKYTIHIRTMAFPRWATVSHTSEGVYYNADGVQVAGRDGCSITDDELRYDGSHSENVSAFGWHFVSHAIRAFRALLGIDRV